MSYTALRGPADCGPGQYYDDSIGVCLCDVGYVPSANGCIPLVQQASPQQNQSVAAVSSGGCGGGQEYDPNSGTCVCMQGYLPAPGGGCIHLADSSSFVAGQSPLPTGSPIIQPSAKQPPLPAVSSSRVTTPQDLAAQAANTTGLIVAGILGGGALLLLLAAR